MNTNYWRDRWLNALVRSGIERNAAEEAFSALYREQPVDHSKSPEIQALMTLASLGEKCNSELAAAN